MTAVILTYHAIEPGPRPLCIEPDLFRAHVDAIARSGVACLTVSQLAAAVRAGELAERAVALTFDDGCESVVQNAAPALARHGLRGTVFCVAGHLGGTNDWPGRRPSQRVLRLASAENLAGVAGSGFEIGSHGFSHVALSGVDEETARREIEESKAMLEAAVGGPVTSFAWPYGARPGEEAAPRIADMYEAACSTEIGRVDAGTDPYALPRIDAHYLRRPELLRRVLEGALDAYLELRAIGARVRRSVRKDYG